VVILISFNNT
jgi:hypothetical protein